MQNYNYLESPLGKVFVTKLEDIPGGVCVAVKDLNVKRVYAGTPIGKDEAGMYHVIKTARIYERSEDLNLNYKVQRGHNFKVGDVLAYCGKGYAIQEITETPDYDVLTLGTTLGVIEAGEVVYHGDKESETGVTFRYSPRALVGTTFDVIEGDNHLTDAIVRGTIIEKNLEKTPLSEDLKSELYHIIFK